MKLVIFYLTSDARHYTFKHFVDLLKSSEKKDEWSLLILTHSDDEAFYSNTLLSSGINFNTCNFYKNNNYMEKVKFAIRFAEDKNIPYLMKCDNDVFITSQTLDYMIDNLSILDDTKHLTLGPTLSSGIPSVEYFIKHFVSNDEANKLYDKFLETLFINRDGVRYTQLNKFTQYSSVWNKDGFFEGVRSIPDHYKGIHPIRINYDSINYLNICILNNKDKFFKTNPTALILNDNSPYLCDSIFCIRRDTYKNIVYDTSLFVDGYDEVPLNKYAWNNSMNHVFVENGFGIHILYNWYENLSEYELNFCNRLFIKNNLTDVKAPIDVVTENSNCSSHIDFTFGIITANGIYLEKIIESIKKQKIPNYEIIIIGNCNILSNDNITIVPFDESIKPNWISRKKNIVYEMAKYDNIVMLHDYVSLTDSWYKGFLEFGDDYEVCVNKIIQMNGDRYFDYFLSPQCRAIDPYIPIRRLLPYDFKLTPQLSKLCYISGAYFCIKKDVALKYPSNEKLSWGQGEDLELFNRLGKNNIVIKCNSMSTVQFLKPKYNSGKWITEINKEEVAILNSLSEDECNSIFNTLSNDISDFYSKNNITI